MVTNQEKAIYNTYLRVSRSAKNKPFTYRKDFSDLDESTALHLKRIAIMLSKYPHIEPSDYFMAPFKVYPNAEYFSLDYYSNMGGVNAYTLYMKQLQEMPPDSDEQLEFIRRSIKYIGSFCIRNNINLEQYATYKTGITYDWMKHVKRHEISIYALMAFPEVSDIIKEAAEDEKELFLGEMGQYFWGYKTKFLRSTLAKELVTEGLKRVSSIVNKKTSEKNSN